MYSLIVTVISIALFSIAISAGVNYIDSDRVIAKNKVMTLERNIASIGLGMITYKNIIKNDATSPEQIIPSFSTLTLNNQNIALNDIGVESYAGNPRARYSCFTVSNANQSDRIMYKKLNSEYPSAQVLLVTTCNNKSDSLVMSDSLSSFRIKFYYL